MIVATPVDVTPHGRPCTSPRAQVHKCIDVWMRFDKNVELSLPVHVVQDFIVRGPTGPHAVRRNGDVGIACLSKGVQLSPNGRFRIRFAPFQILKRKSLEHLERHPKFLKTC